MANAEHVAVVREGARAVAAWRERNPDGRLDLGEADLDGVDLAEADLSGANLRLASLDGANLSGAKLAGATLEGATLDKANLSNGNLKEANLNLAHLAQGNLSLGYFGRASLREADLGGANLYFAHLRGADLTAAGLVGANLKKADLRDAVLTAADLTGADLGEADLYGARLDKTALAGADFTGARCGETLFTNLDLSQAKGLETVGHSAPSTLGVEVLYLSRGELPGPFLQGCGAPEDLVAFASSLAESPAADAFSSSFLSYSRQDQEFAARLAARLREEHLRVWDASETMQGWKTPEQMDQALRAFDNWLLVLSKNNLKSDWVLTEVRRARDAEAKQKCRLFLMRLVDLDSIKKWFESAAGKDARQELGSQPIPDFSNWKDADAFEAAFARLLKNMRSDH
jgi:uncharacterized protein YjbI with pentapeptide repeats